MSNEHQPGSPFVDLDALERRLELDLGSWGNSKNYAAVFAELRTLRARVAEIETDSTPADWNAAEVALNKALDLQRENEQLRARVAELEACLTDLHLFAGRGDGHETAGKVTECIAGVIIQLRSDLARAESVEARMKDLEAAAAPFLRAWDSGRYGTGVSAHNWRELHLAFRKESKRE